MDRFDLQWNSHFIAELPPSDSEEESSEEESDKHKGVEHLIEIQNPNRSGARQAKKISELNEDGTAQLSRRERWVNVRRGESGLYISAAHRPFGQQLFQKWKIADPKHFIF